MKKIYSQRSWLLRNVGEIRITVRSELDTTRTNKDDNIFVWLYNVKIENTTPATIKIIAGHWEIFDKYGKANIQDPVLSDEQPIIKSTETLDSTNLVQLFSDSGVMYGKYFIVNLDSNKEFSIDIPPISLDSFIEKEQWN